MYPTIKSFKTKQTKLKNHDITYILASLSLSLHFNPRYVHYNIG